MSVKGPAPGPVAALCSPRPCLPLPVRGAAAPCLSPSSRLLAVGPFSVWPPLQPPLRAHCCGLGPDRALCPRGSV